MPSCVRDVVERGAVHVGVVAHVHQESVQPVRAHVASSGSIVVRHACIAPARREVLAHEQEVVLELRGVGVRRRLVGETSRRRAPR